MLHRKYGIALCLAAACGAISAGASLSADGEIGTAKATSTSRNFGSVPLSFEENTGQSESRVRYVSRGEGYSLFLTDTGAEMSLGKGASGRDLLKMTVVGTRGAERSLRGENELPGKVNYFVGKDPRLWRSGLPTYGKVHYAAVYPGIDLVYYGNQRQLEYDFVVAPRANAGEIRLQFSGQRRLRIDLHGDLVLQGRHGSASFHRPEVYQQVRGERIPVMGSFRMLAKNTIGFAIGSYDHSRPLVIDPVFAYSTYLGGSQGYLGTPVGDVARGVAVDDSGSAYVVGYTYDTDFPVTAHAYQKDHRQIGGTTAFVTKFNAAGTALVYSTYLGGTGANGDLGLAIAVDEAKNAYVTGSATSADFPVTSGAFQTVDPAPSLASSVFVTKLNAAGSALMYSTYIGGTKGDEGNAIAVDASGSAYVTGHTASPDFPVTDGAFQPKFGPGVGGSGSNAFVSKLNPTGTALVYSTFLGGTGKTNPNYTSPGDSANAISVDSAGNAYVAGDTASIDFPVTSGAFQTASTTGRAAFVTKLNANGSAAVYSTYINFDTGESANGIAVDSAGAAYIVGETTSSNFPVSAGLKRLGNLFLAKVHADGSTLDFANQFGNGSLATGVAVDEAGSAYVAGTTTSPADFPSTPDGNGQLAAGSGVVFVVKFAPSGIAEEFATAFGGSGQFRPGPTGENGNAIAVDPAGNVYVAGDTTSPDFPTTAKAFQREYTAGARRPNAFVSKLALGGKTTAHVQTEMTIAAPQSVVPQGDKAIVTVAVSEVSGAAVSSGTVLFLSTVRNRNGTFTSLIGQAPVDENGNAAFINANLQPATYHFSATYLGDETHLSTSTSYSSPTSVDVTVTARPTLTITLGRVASRHYGASNPPLTYTAVGLVDASPVTITAQTTATTTSPVGTYPVTATVTGAHANDYIVNVIGTTLTIRPALVGVVANSETIGYGQTPAQPAGYSFLHLLNGDTASVVTGVPVLSTGVTATTPAGYYSIHIDVSPLTSPNYYFAPFAQPGTVHVTKATLVIQPDNLTMRQGGSMPPLTYHLVGFVNGDAAASAVTGTTTLRTTASAKSRPGTYAIVAAYGTLYSPNYSFIRGTGTLTILP